MADTIDEKEIDKAKDDVKAGGEQTKKDKIDESVADQEKKSGEDSQDSKDRVDESEGEKKADDKNDDKKSDDDGGMKNSPDDKKTLADVEEIKSGLAEVKDILAGLAGEIKAIKEAGTNQVVEAPVEEASKLDKLKNMYSI